MSLGKFIVIYGVNALGKTTQVRLLADRMDRIVLDAGREPKTATVRLKYPVYDLAPSGHLINEYLRSGNPYGLSAETFQTLQALNRTHFEPSLIGWLKSGRNVVAEDYIGTSIAWGMVAGVNREYLERMNRHLVLADVAVLIDGQYFAQATEKNHKHESNAGLMRGCSEIHRRLAEDFGWLVVNGNQEPDRVHEDIWKVVTSKVEIV